MARAYGLKIDEKTADGIKVAWLGCNEGHVAGIFSDHRPLVVEMGYDEWLGGTPAKANKAVKAPEPAWPPRHWIAASDKEYEEACEVAKELGRKPTKVSWADYEAAVEAQDEGPHWDRVRREAGVAIRDRAARGSPWLPVQISTILSSGKNPASASETNGGRSAR